MGTTRCVSRRFEVLRCLQYDSCPSHFHESGFFFEFEAVRTASSDRAAPRRRMDVDVDALTSCGIGRTVNKLKKAESEDVQTLAKALVKKWKDLVAAQEPFFVCVRVVDGVD